MNEISDRYNKRLLEYADKQEIFDCKMSVEFYLFFYCLSLCCATRINGQYTLDNIASCLFGIETNSLQDHNSVLIKHLKKFFTVSLTNILLLILRKCIPMILKFSYCYSVMSPRLGSYLGKKGYSVLPKDAIDYVSTIVNDIIVRRRQGSERRNDFIQIMIDHEEESKVENTNDEQQQIESKEQKIGLKKSMSSQFDSFLCSDRSL